MRDVMLDLETMSARPNASIVSIGAVLFDRNDYDTVDSVKDANRCFYLVVDLEEQAEEFGRHISPSTIYWWLQQNEDAQNALAVRDRCPLGDALLRFSKWLSVIESPRLWGYGATFDNVVICSAYDAVGLPHPIHYRNHRCMRTIVALTDTSGPDKSMWTAHNALSDAQRQVLWLQEAFRFIKEGNLK
jgi:hypothetical protein